MTSCDLIEKATEQFKNAEMSAVMLFLRQPVLK